MSSRSVPRTAPPRASTPRVKVSPRASGVTPRTIQPRYITPRVDAAPPRPAGTYRNVAIALVFALMFGTIVVLVIVVAQSSSPSPSPPLSLLPPPPPPLPGAPPTPMTVTTSVVAEGDIADFTPAILSAMGTKVATHLAVAPTAVTVSVSPASVLINISVAVASVSAAATATSALATQVASPATASTFLSTPALTLNVTSILSQPASMATPLSPPPPVFPNTSDASGRRLFGAPQPGQAAAAPGLMGLMHAANPSGDSLAIPVFDLCYKVDTLFVHDGLGMRWCTARGNRTAAPPWGKCGNIAGPETLVTVVYGTTSVSVTRATCAAQLASKPRGFVATPLSCGALYIQTARLAPAWIVHPDLFATNLSTDADNVFVLDPTARFLSSKLLRIDSAFADRLLEAFREIALGRRTVFKDVGMSTLSQTFVRHFGRGFVRYNDSDARVWSHRRFWSDPDDAKATNTHPYALTLPAYDPRSDPIFTTFRTCVQSTGTRVWRRCSEAVVRTDQSIAALKVSHDNHDCIHSSEEPTYQCSYVDSGENNSFREVHTNTLRYCALHERCVATSVWFDFSVGCRVPERKIVFDLAAAATLSHTLDAMDVAVPVHADDAPRIPNNLHFNYYTANVSEMPEVLRQNMQHTMRLHTNATIFVMDDTECAMKLARRSDVGDKLLHWFAEAPGKYKSDICRLVQLDEAGGVYMDSDMHPLQNMHALLGSAAFATVRAFNEDFRNDLFQSFLASVPGHPLIRRALHYINDWVEGKRASYDLIGPSMLAQALEDEYGTAVQRQTAGILLLDEVRQLNSTARMQSDTDNCNYVIITKDKRVVAYSRMVRTGRLHDSQLLPCV